MPEGSPPRGSAGRRSSGEGPVAHLDLALWRQLAEAETADVFCRSWLALQARMIGGVSAGIVVLESPESGSLQPVAVWPEGFAEPVRFAAVVDRALRERKGVVTRAVSGDAPALGEPGYWLAYPVRSGDRVRGVVALEIGSRPQIQLQSAMRQLQWGSAWLHNWVLRSSADPGAHAGERMAAALELTAVALEEPDFRSAATSFVTELATRLDCDRVAAGFVERGRLKLRALSHSAQFGQEMELIRAIGNSMEESIDQQETLVYPEPDAESTRVLHAHDQLARRHGDTAVCTVPFVDRRGRPFGALTLERTGPRPFDRETVELVESLASLVGPILEDKRLNDRWVLVKLRDSLAEQLGRLFGPRHMLRKLVAVTLVALAVFFFFARGQFRVTAKTVLEGEVQRSVVAPFRGFIAEAGARAGDVVSEGQVLCRLDQRDLRLEHSRWSSERQQYVLEHRRAMAERDAAAAKVLDKRINQAEAQLALLDQQLRRATIVAPFEGLVVSGDLSQALGSPVELGEVLFEVAPLDSYRVMLQVDERDIGEIEVGQTGELILTALPGTRLPFVVERITPVSMPLEGRNFFLVEAGLAEATDRLRPGMEGFGKIEVDRRRLIWIWTHRLVDWVRLKLWAWRP